ncbi:P-loop containing nucleoside triphosphate hydrolase protein [Ganoderma leucocontextum]|nr:P-loop containing nucleoside triphosphate hydrolase protein [Ganoderma leucocontextum]
MHCPVCNIQVSGRAPWQDHASSGRHARKAAAHGVASEDVQPGAPPAKLFKQCKLCREAHPNRLWRHHLASNAHKRREEHVVLRSAYERAGQDKGGIVVSHADSDVDFGVVDLARANQGLEVALSISANGPTRSTVSVTSVNVSPQIGQRSSPFSVTVTPASIAHGKTLLLPIRFRHGQRGHFEGRVEIVFQRTGSSSFSIWRTVKAVVGEAADRERLKPIAKYVRRPRAPWHHNRPVVSGERPPALFATPWVKKLTLAPIPTELAEMVKTKPAEAVIGYITQRYMGTGTLSKANHSPFFRALLWVEEVRAVEDLHMYDLVNAQFIKEGSLYTLRVEGLSEKRPSVVVGDAIRVQEANVPGDHTHEGFVHTVRLQDIRVSFHRSFNVTGKRFHVCFQLNRTPLRRQHQALCATTPANQRLLFPNQMQAGLARPLAAAELPLTLFNDLISTNPAQLQAVKSIASLRPGMAPFIIFGPPGTGKTVTVVEAIRQILHRQPRATILACAPSNSAADIIAERLTMFTPAEITRCNAASRDPASVPAALVPYTHYAGDHYALPSREQLMQYRLTVSTCGNASFAHNIGIRQGHYSHIIVDEAGQASEPEVLTAIKAMAGANTIVILAGDPKQLGPVIRSSIARELGLGKSYLERLIEMPLYSSPNGRGTSYIKLIKNYRSHEAILRYPNQQFYDDELEVCGQPATINKFIGSPQLVSPWFPIVFHAISGTNEREASSPSYFNIDEASQVKAYIQALLGDARHPIRPEDIAVVTQYHAQVLKIRKLLRETGIAKGVMVTSVENIQGQERPVIIMSTVRSSQELLAYDAKFTLGFISNPRRFNVAVTRAQALLIVVGDPSVLSIDPLWRGFMNYIYLHGGWRGAAPTWDVNAPVKTSGDYAEDIREAAAEEMNEFMERVQNGEDIEAEANVERHFVEMD